MQCTKCHFGKLTRTNRLGLLEERILPLFGYFPWICSECKRRAFFKSRGERIRTREKEYRPTSPSRSQKDSLHQVQ